MPEPAISILVVEDEQIVAVAIEGQLKQLGYRVAGMAASADEAHKLAIQDRPDLVLMDVHIEGSVDGVEAARRIRESLDVPVVFLTAYTDVETVERAKLAQPYGYIVKPFDPRDLRTTVEIALHKADTDRKLRESHENLQTILDAQRHGTVILDCDGRIRFASQAAIRMAGVVAGEASGRSLAELLSLSDVQAKDLILLRRCPPSQRHKIGLVLKEEGSRSRHMEIEVVDDPRHDGGAILFLYDVSPLFDLRRQLDGEARFQEMIGKSKPMRMVFQTIEDVARVDSTVLIEGETGTGKELVARAIHQLSTRRNAPFVAVNCAGLSDELATSQLFGHRRGSFTGASSDQQGLFEAAHGGTLFLDEIGDLSLRVQTALLRVLEENKVLRVGEVTPRPLDVRILAATHRNLVDDVRDERFRQDLLYRIRIARVQLPALRQRREDLPILVRAFLADHRASTGKQVDAVSDDAMGLLLDCTWPGNVRELRNALEYAVVRARGSILQADDLPPELQLREIHSHDGDSDLSEIAQLKAVLRRAGGNRTKAAALLGISRATLYRRMAELDFDDES